MWTLPRRNGPNPVVPKRINAFQVSRLQKLSFDYCESPLHFQVGQIRFTQMIEPEFETLRARAVELFQEYVSTPRSPGNTEHALNSD